MDIIKLNINGGFIKASQEAYELLVFDLKIHTKDIINEEKGYYYIDNFQAKHIPICRPIEDRGYKKLYINNGKLSWYEPKQLIVISDKKSIENRADHIPDSSKKVSMPIYRGKKIDSDEYVEGFYYKSKAGYTREYHAILRGSIEYDESIAPDSIIEIDPSTLAISFDDGDTWYDDFQLIDETLESYYPKGI